MVSTIELWLASLTGDILDSIHIDDCEFKLSIQACLHGYCAMKSVLTDAHYCSLVPHNVIIRKYLQADIDIDQTKSSFVVI